MKFFSLPVKNIDKGLVTLFLTLIFFNILSVYTTSYNFKTDLEVSEVFFTNLYYVTVSICIFFILTKVDYGWYKFGIFNIVLQSITFLLLLIVLWSPAIADVHRWIQVAGFQFQPSELTKLTIILSTASIYANSTSKIISVNNLKTNVQDFIKPLAISTILVFFSVLLIILQPSGGMALLMFTSFLVSIILINQNSKLNVLFFSCILVPNLNLLGINNLVIFLLLTVLICSLLYYLRKNSYIFIFLIILSTLIQPFFHFIWESGIIKDYQKARIEAFVNPGEDNKTLNQKFQQDRAKEQIQSSSFWGKGYTKGTKNIDNATPAIQTDFAYTAFVEEMGLLGALCFHIIILVLLIKFFSIYKRVSEVFAKIFILMSGVFIFNTYILSILINIGLMFNTGIPTPFISYGGSALLVYSALFGIIHNISIQNKT